jgi:hypothetical protein
MKALSRRDFMKLGGLALAGAAGVTALAQTKADPKDHSMHANPVHGDESMPGTMGEVDHQKNGFHPTDILTDYDYGRTSTSADGRTLYEVW